MKKFCMILCLVIIFLLCSCVTQGWKYRYYSKPEYLGKSSVEKIYYHPLFIGRSPIKKRKELYDMLQKKAKTEFGDNVLATNIRYESKWHPASLFFLGSTIGFVERAIATGDVFDPVKDIALQDLTTENIKYVQEDPLNDKDRILKEEELNQTKKAKEAALQKEKESEEQQKRDIAIQEKLKQENTNYYNNLFSPIKSQGLPLAISDFATKAPNSAGGVDCSISFYNTSDKVIKYVYFDVVPYNRVDDIAYSEINGKSTRTIKLIDFINPDGYYSATWENVWYNNSISYMKIDSVKVIFKDNIESIIDPDKIELITIPNIVTKTLYDKNDITVSISFNRSSGTYYFNFSSPYKQEKLMCFFETEPLTIFNQIEKDILDSMTSHDYRYENTGSSWLYIFPLPNSKALLLTTVKSLTVFYDKNVEETAIIEIDGDPMKDIQDLAYEMEIVGLR